MKSLAGAKDVIISENLAFYSTCTLPEESPGRDCKQPLSLAAASMLLGDTFRKLTG